MTQTEVDAVVLAVLRDHNADMTPDEVEGELARRGLAVDPFAARRAYWRLYLAREAVITPERRIRAVAGAVRDTNGATT